MLWSLLILAVLVGFLTELICYILKIRTFAVILILQFLASFSASYGRLYFISGNTQQETSMVEILGSLFGKALISRSMLCS